MQHPLIERIGCCVGHVLHEPVIALDFAAEQAQLAIRRVSGARLDAAIAAGDAFANANFAVEQRAFRAVDLNGKWCSTHDIARFDDANRTVRAAQGYDGVVLDWPFAPIAKRRANGLWLTEKKARQVNRMAHIDQRATLRELGIEKFIAQKAARVGRRGEYGAVRIAHADQRQVAEQPLIDG